MITAEKAQTAAETMARVEEIYEGLKASLDTPENRGRFITIDTLSGDYEISRDIIVGWQALRARHEAGVLTGTLKIGIGPISHHHSRRRAA